MSEEKPKKKLSASTITIIVLCVLCIVLSASCFACGRWLRLKDAPGRFEQDLDDARSEIDRIEAELNDARAKLNALTESGRVANEQLSNLQSANEQLRLFQDEVKRTIEDNQRITEDFKSTHAELSGTVEYAIDLAIQQSEQYERLIDSLQQSLEPNQNDK